MLITITWLSVVVSTTVIASCADFPLARHTIREDRVTNQKEVCARGKDFVEVSVACFSTTCEENIVRADYLKVMSRSYRVINIIAGKYSSYFSVAFI